MRDVDLRILETNVKVINGLGYDMFVLTMIYNEFEDFRKKAPKKDLQKLLDYGIRLYYDFDYAVPQQIGVLLSEIYVDYDFEKVDYDFVKEQYMFDDRFCK